MRRCCLRFLLVSRVRIFLSISSRISPTARRELLTRKSCTHPVKMAFTGFTTSFAGFAPLFCATSRIRALMACRAFFFGVIRIKYPVLLRFWTRLQSKPRTEKASPGKTLTVRVFSRFSSPPKGSRYSCRLCHASSAHPRLLACSLTVMTLSSANRWSFTAS